MSLSVIGVMSGSSLDGLDMALCSFPDHLPEDSQRKVEWEIKEALSIPYTSEWKTRLRDAPSLNGFDLMRLDAEFGIYIGEQLKNWMTEKKIDADLVASHGHTVFHEPGLHFSTQIGHGAHIASITQVDTIADFRMADVAHAGQGAPFAPIADRDLFSGYEGYLNLGGIANISLFSQDKKLQAWDICPCNQALNFLAEKLGHAYDSNGLIAASGKIMEEVVLKLTRSFSPKVSKKTSLSNATVEETWLTYLQQSNFDFTDLLASTTESIAQLIFNLISPVTKRPSTILVTGGGAHNSFLMQRLNSLGAQSQIVFEKPVDLIIDFKESLLMAYLGYLTYQRKPYGIQSITGANHDSIGGAYYKTVK